MYTALYRAYRPEVFDEILGQEHVVKILKNQINTDSASHAYLFCGTRGTGKTTTARILAKGLNCLSEGSRPCGECSVCRGIKEGTYLDVVEIDAASNNGVDHIRELRESVKYPPAVGRKKVYIIDEVHMLSTEAFNALLKTLEEPPEYVVFILATTEPQKLPATILSRCMRLDFKRVPEHVLISGMAEICRERKIDVTEEALRIIAANADGSVRDGLSLLDQCLSGGDTKIEAADVLDFLGASGEETFVELTDLVRKGKVADAIVLLARALSDGKDVRQFMKDWINHYRNLLMTRFIKDPQDIINMSFENIERIRRQSESLELNDINRGILELSRTMNEARWSTQPRILLELAIVKLAADPEKVNAPVIQRQEPRRQQFTEQRPNPSNTIQEQRRSAEPVSGRELNRTMDSEMAAPTIEPWSEPASAMAPPEEFDEDDDRQASALDALLQKSSGTSLQSDSRSQMPEYRAEEPAAYEMSEPIPRDDAALQRRTLQERMPAESNTASAEAPQQFDCDALWNAVFEDGEAMKGSFYIIGSSAHLASVGEHEFTVAANSDYVRKHAERNRELLENLMEKHTGKRRQMKLVMEEELMKPQEQSVAEIAHAAEAILGINVEIES